MGITLQQLYEQYTPRTLFNHLNGYWDHHNMYLRAQWEVARFNLVPQLNIQLKRNKQFKTDQEFVRFPWEATKPQKKEMSKLTPAEKEKIKAAFKTA